MSNGWSALLASFRSTIIRNNEAPYIYGQKGVEGSAVAHGDPTKTDSTF